MPETNKQMFQQCPLSHCKNIIILMLLDRKVENFNKQNIQLFHELSSYIPTKYAVADD